MIVTSSLATKSIA
jgi:hypothetical protein